MITNLKEILKAYYNSVKNSQDLIKILSFLEDYIKFIKNTPEFREVIDKLENEEKKQIQEKELLKKQAIKELRNAAEILIKRIKENQIPIDNKQFYGIYSIENLKNHITQKNITDNDIKIIEEILFEISVQLYQRGYRSLLKEFIDKNPKIPNNRLDNKNLVFSKTLGEFYNYEEKMDVDIEKSKKTWVCWRYINLLDFFNPYKKNDKEIYLFLSHNPNIHYSFVAELLMLRSKRKETINSSKKFFENELIKNCQFCTEKIFNYLLEYLNKKEITQTKEEKRGNKFPYKLPAGTKWEHLIIKFIDGYTLKIKFSNYPNLSPHKETYEGLGLEDKRQKKPNKQWELLRSLAENKGEIDWASFPVSYPIKKRKSLLSKALKNYFDYQILDDPFFSYRKEKYYSAKFKIYPEEYEDIKEYEKYFSKEELEKIKKQKEIEKEYKKQTRSQEGYMGI